jgi:hypothetical protein
MNCLYLRGAQLGSSDCAPHFFAGDAGTHVGIGKKKAW